MCKMYVLDQVNLLKIVGLVSFILLYPSLLSIKYNYNSNIIIEFYSSSLVLTFMPTKISLSMSIFQFC